MHFVDEAKIVVQGGDGGRGCESTYRDLWMRYDRPDGGDGGNGGDVILVADRNTQTLLDFRYKAKYKAGRGGHASSKGIKGARGETITLRVPVGTIVRDEESGLLIKDLSEDKQSIIVAKGGLGGKGNRNGRIPLDPLPGEERTLTLELKLIADVGVVGFPNAGKSSLVSSISKVKSKVANYPFTTKQPILGVVQGKGGFSFAIADLPGIIEGAHKGKGLGDRFLRHAERTKMIVHIIDMGASEGRDPLEDYKKINHELKEYSETFEDKERLVVANKMDLPEAAENLKRFKKKYKKVKVYPISTATREGIDDLLKAIQKSLSVYAQG